MYFYSMLHRFIAIQLATLVLLTNVWVPVYTHVCNGRGQLWQSVGFQARSCCSRSQTAKRCHPAPAKNRVGIHKKPCCENRIGFIQTHSTFTAGIGAIEFKCLASQPLPPPAMPALSGALTAALQSGLFWPHAPPLPLFGRSLLLFQQVFRI